MLVALAVLGFIAGIASGMFGIGGGVIIVPVLMFMGQTQVQANATSLAALLLPVGAFGVMSYHRNQMIRWRVAMITAVGLLFGGYDGAVIANRIDPTILLRLYGGFLLFVGWRMAAPIQFVRERRGLPIAESRPEGAPVEQIWAVVLLGLVAGVASGLFGIGGGAVIVPILVTFMNFPQKTAVGTSLGALLPPVALLAAVEYYQQGQLNIEWALPVAAGLVFGAWLGARITIALPAATVKRLYGVFLLVMGTRFILGL